LLLEGNEPWLSVESTQYYDVQGETLPDAKFYSALGHVVTRLEGPTVQPPVDEGKRSFKPDYMASPPRLRTGVVLASIAGIVILLAAIIPLIRSVLSQNSPPATEANPTFLSAPEETFVPESGATEITVVAGEPSQVPSDFTDPQGVPMSLVPAGEFTMGSRDIDAALVECQNYDPSCDHSWFEDELFPHPVTLDAFRIDTYEVTNRRYADCVNAGTCQPPTDTSSATRSSYFGNSAFDDYPVIFIEWDMAKTYCEWRGARLPTEAEWEKAARGTDERTYPWGAEVNDTYANYNDNLGDTSAVGSYESGKSIYGLYDMAGNVWEWVADYYLDNYYANSPSSNPFGPDSGTHLLRGGSWYDPAYLIRTTVRKGDPLPRDNNYGFRCARGVNP